jgi:hypothetical protein
MIIGAALTASVVLTTHAVTPTDPNGNAITQDFLGGSGGPMTAPGFRLNGTLGQPVAAAPSVAGDIQLFHGIYIPQFGGGICRDGDVDLSCAITPGDALLAFQHFLQQTQLTAEQQGHADVDNPQTPPSVTPADALCIFQFFLQEPSCLNGFPLGCSDCP